MKKKMYSSAALLLASTVALSACSGGGSSTPSASPGGASSNTGGSSGGETTLSIMWWGSDARHEATQKALEIYSKQFPNIKFKPEFMAWDAYWTKLPTLAASKSITDVLQMDAAYIQEYVTRGQLEDLTDIDLTGIVDANVIENLKMDGKLYGIPLSLNSQGMAYNKEALEEYGIPLPKTNWTYEEYFQWARDASAKLPDGKYPIGDVNTWDGYNFYQTAMGKPPMMADGGKTFTLDKETFTTMFETYAKLREEGVVPPAEKTASFLENDPQADAVASGTVMVRSATTGSVGALEQLMPGKLGVVNMPGGPAGAGWAQSTIFLSVSANSKNKEEAKKFVKWFITDKEAGTALGLTRGIPINPEIYAAIEPTLEPKDKLGKDIYDQSVEKAMPFYSVAAGFTEYVDAFKKEIDAVIFGQQSIEAAYNNLNNLGQDLSKRAK